MTIRYLLSCLRLIKNMLTFCLIFVFMMLNCIFQTVSLRSRCEHALKHHIDDDTVFYLLSLGDQLSAKTLKVGFL